MLVFIGTSVVGPAAAAVTKSVVETISSSMNERRKNARLRKIKVLLYGPDGKEIKWE